MLKDLSLTIKQGEKIALVGESGSGKTTLVKLLMNFYPWEKGDITIKGYNVKDIDLEFLRERISYISQDIFMFSGTIRENLCLGRTDIEMDEIMMPVKWLRHMILLINFHLGMKHIWKKMPQIYLVDRNNVWQ